MTDQGTRRWTNARALLAGARDMLVGGARRVRDALSWAMDPRRTAFACITMFATVSVVDAAQQCFTQAGTFGGLTVTQSGSGCGTFLNYEGFSNGLWLGNDTSESCTFTLSPAVQGNTLSVGLRAHSCNGTTFCEEARFLLNGTHYVVQPADLVTPAGGVGSPVMINGAGDIVEAPGGSSDGSGLVTFNSAPASVSSITIDHVITLGAPAGTIYQVCADDAGGVGPGGTTTAVVSSLNPSVVGQAVTFTATVTGTTPTGTVQFKDGAANLGAPVTLAGGTAAFTTSSLSAGTHSITAVYSGDADDASSTSPAVSQLVSVVPVASTQQPIPTLSEWLLVLLTAMVAGLGMTLRRRS
jgi:Bacterial Ig-like domain (group 3)/IPTL-CTERM motif